MKLNTYFTYQRILWLILVMTFLSTSSCKTTSKEPQANIILCLVDDMGLMDTSVPFLADSSGKPVSYPLNDYYHTPNMELLAEQGVRFTNFYAHSVCSPTRSTILSGQNAARHRTTNWINAESNNRTEFGPSEWNWEGLRSNSVTLARVLQQAGYRSIHVGKAHFGPTGSEGEDPLNLGFDVNIAGCAIGHPGSYYGEDGYGHIRGQKARAVPGLDKYHGKDIFLTEALTLEARTEITRAVEMDQPFFLYLAHYAVHAPFQADPRFIDHYTNSDKSEQARAYASLIEGVDKSLGDIISHVKALGVDKNTLLIFLGDNGSDAPLPIVDHYSSSAPLKGKKGNHWEGGMRVPFIAAWLTPDDNHSVQKGNPVARNAIQEQMGSIMDLFPTLCRVAGAAYPENHTLDGFDLHKQLAAQQNTDRDSIFLNHFPHGNHRTNYFTSLVYGKWKVIYHYPVKDSAFYELYHLEKDPFESHNLAYEHPDQLKVMMELLVLELKDKKAVYPEVEGKVLVPGMEEDDN